MPKITLRRRGLSLLEVLLAIFVASVGLLALAALVPLGQHYARSANQSDRGGSTGREAMRKVESYQMLRWENWVQLRANGSWVSNPTPWVHPDFTGTPNQYTFLIDPLFFGQVGSNPTAAFFPYTAPAGQPRMCRISLARSHRRVDPLLLLNGAGVPFVLDGVPLPTNAAARTQYIIDNSPMSLAHADSIFRMRDDLEFFQVNDDSLARPQIKPFDSGATANIGDDAGVVNTGNYSWAVMVQPADTESAYRNPGANAGDLGGLTPDERRLFHITVIVFRGRDFSVTGNKERYLDAGQVQMSDDVLILSAADAAGLAPNQWIMVSGWRKPSLGPGGGNNIDHYWYRITQIGKFNRDNVAVRIAGPPWTHGLYQGGLRAPQPPATAYVTIAETVVGVFERTVEIDPRSYGAN